MKVDLSTTENAKIDFSRPGVRVTAEMGRSRFENLIRPSLTAIAETVDHALDSACVEPSDVGLVVRTGGSSRIPAFVSLLEERFGTDRVHERDAFATVTHGLGVHALNLWGT